MTAMEWLIDQLTEYNYLHLSDKPDDMHALLTIIPQAKEMEKQQTVDAYSHGWHDGQDVIIAQVKHIDKGGEVAGNEYYNETKGGTK